MFSRKHQVERASRPKAMAGWTSVLILLTVGLTLQPQPRLTNQELSGQRTSRLNQVQRCQDGTQVTLGGIQKPWQLRHPGEKTLGGYVLVRQPGSQAFGLLAGIEGQPLRLSCTTLGGKPVFLLLHRDDTGASLSLVDVRTRAVYWEVLLANADTLVDDLAVKGDQVLLVSRSEQAPGQVEMTAIQLATGEVVEKKQNQSITSLRNLHLAATLDQVWLAGEWEQDTTTHHVFIAPVNDLTVSWTDIQRLASGANDTLHAAAALDDQVCLSGFTHGLLRLQVSNDQVIPPNAKPLPADAFVSCLGGGQGWLKQLGSPQHAEAFTALALDTAGVTVSGYTDATTWPTPQSGSAPVRRGLMAHLNPQGEVTQLRALAAPYPVTPTDLTVDQEGHWLLVGQSEDAALAMQLNPAFEVTSTLRFSALRDHLSLQQP